MPEGSHADREDRPTCGEGDALIDQPFDCVRELLRVELGAAVFGRAQARGGAHQRAGQQRASRVEQRRSRRRGADVEREDEVVILSLLLAAQAPLVPLTQASAVQAAGASPSSGLV
ncbi:hypothetical protein HRbin26_02194 [bacterium HR26]|nr:hypothetical protein HRbin26_02194 [bacterium HR26]